MHKNACLISNIGIKEISKISFIFLFYYDIMEVDLAGVQPANKIYLRRRL